MTRTTHPLVAHIACQGPTPSPLATALAGLPGPVLRFEEASSCLNSVPSHGEVVFLVERSALPAGGLMWLILLAESRRGPVILVENGRDHDPGAALRAGVHCVVCAPDFTRTASVQSLVLDAFEQFERRAPRSPWKHARRTGELPPPPGRTPSNGAGTGIDAIDVRAYLRDALNEFRTPLTAAVEFASILDDGIAGPLNAKQREYAGYIIEACHELLELYGDFRHSAGLRLGANDPDGQVFKIGYAVEEALAVLKTTRVTFRLDEPDKPVKVYGDRDALVTAISRIAQRAAKCSTRGSEVVVRLRNVANVRVEIAVLDHGPTPTENDTQLLCDGLVNRGELTKSVTQVFGVGMELARAVVLGHGSELELAARGERGARIAFSLPIATD